LYPGSRIATLIPLGIVFWRSRIPAWAFIGIWFLFQFFSGVAAISDVNTGGVAYSAHVGGFLAGLLLVPLFIQAPRVERMRAYHGI